MKKSKIMIKIEAELAEIKAALGDRRLLVWAGIELAYGLMISALVVHLVHLAFVRYEGSTGFYLVTLFLTQTALVAAGIGAAEQRKHGPAILGGAFPLKTLPYVSLGLAVSVPFLRLFDPIGFSQSLGILSPSMPSAVLALAGICCVDAAICALRSAYGAGQRWILSRDLPTSIASNPKVADQAAGILVNEACMVEGSEEAAAALRRRMRSPRPQDALHALGDRFSFRVARRIESARLDEEVFNLAKLLPRWGWMSAEVRLALRNAVGQLAARDRADLAKQILSAMKDTNSPSELREFCEDTLLSLPSANDVTRLIASELGAMEQIQRLKAKA